MKTDSVNSYIYCTPFLDEIDRIRLECGKHRFAEPRNFSMSKIDSFNDLLAKGRDIAVTHSTFLNATSETVELIHQGEYILILDEALDVVVDFNDVASVGNSVEQILKSKDIEVLIRDKLISVADNGLVTWIGGDYSGTKFSEVERLAKLNRLYCVNGSMMVCVFPPEVFRAFKEVYVMTYLLEGTFIKYYFDIFGIPRFGRT